jgi:hypothetical protein
VLINQLGGFVTRTIGSAIGVLLVVLFMAHLATRLAPSLSAASTTSASSRR